MNLERYAKALAAEVDATVDAFMSEAESQEDFGPQNEPVQQEPINDRLSVVQDIYSVYRQDRKQSSLFPGSSPLLERFDRDRD